MEKKEQSKQKEHLSRPAAPNLAHLIGNHAVLQAMDSFDEPLLGNLHQNDFEEEEEEKGEESRQHLPAHVREMGRVREQLFHAYLIIYEQHHELLDALDIRLIFEIDPNPSIIPAYTSNTGRGPVTVYFQYWFLRNSTLGQLIGMANHELGVHSLTNRIFDLLRNQTIAEINQTITYYTTTPPANFSPAQIQNALDFAYTQLAAAQSDFGQLLNDMATLQISDIRINLADSTHVLTLILNHLNLHIAPPSDFPDHGVNEHIEAATLSFTDGEPIEMLPRAAAYLATTFQSVNALALTYPDLAVSEPLVDHVTDILFFYFLDIARTWVETRADDWLHHLNHFYYVDFLVRPLLASMSDITAGILAYLDRVIPAGGVLPNTLTGLLSPQATAAVIAARPMLQTRLGNIRSELTALWFRAIIGRFMTGTGPSGS